MTIRLFEFPSPFKSDALKGDEAWSAIVKMSAKEAFKGGGGLLLSRLKNKKFDVAGTFTDGGYAFMEDDDCEHYNYACY